jgi:23S rRNA (adenine2030-N6)-methyltransferase
MQYKHTFHAGNFADVHKHISLLQLVFALRRKAKGFFCLDTHAGEGLYDLGSGDARHSGESSAGIQRLDAALEAANPTAHAAIRDYAAAVERIRRAHGNSRHVYPGSPLLVATALREADALTCVESQAHSARALQRAFERDAALLAATPRVITGDGYHEVRRLLPPPQRRGLVHIDPPYESQDEEKQVAAALIEGLTRFETGVFAVWYPIKKQHETDLWLARVTRGITRPAVVAELCLREPDNTAGLNGSGMLVINPPWQFDTDAAQWQTELHDLLGATGGSRVKWLIHE